MKKTTKFIALLSGAALLTSNGFAADSVSTDPVGYVTETLKPATFNLIGVNLASSVVASGAFESSGVNVATDADADFLTNLPAGSEYVLQLTSGEGVVGINTTASASSATELAVADDLSAVILAGTTYEIRKVLTVSDLFGDANSAELAGAVSGDTSAADIVWIPNGAGGYTKVYYNTVARVFPPLSIGWKTTLTSDDDAANTPVYFTDGTLIQVQRSEFSASEAGVVAEDLTSKGLVLTGNVISQSTQSVVETGFNYLNRVFPGEVTLADSDLELEINHASAGDLTNADILWVPNGAGGYIKYYYNGTARIFPPLSVGWKSTLTSDNDAADGVLTSGFILERKGAGTMITLRIPSAVSL